MLASPSQTQPSEENVMALRFLGASQGDAVGELFQVALRLGDVSTQPFSGDTIG